MAVTSSASIQLNLTVANQDAWNGVVETVRELKTSLDALARGNSRRGTVAMMQKEIDRLKQSFADFKTGVAAAGLQLDKTAKSGDQVAASTRRVNSEVAKSYRAWQQDKKAVAEAEREREEFIVTQSRLNSLIKQMNTTLGSTRWGKSVQAGPFQAMLRDMQRLQVESKKAGTAIPIEKLRQYAAAVDKAKASTQRWRDEMGKLAGRLTFFEQQMDAIFRASYRFKAVGADLQQFARGIYTQFRTLMDDFGEFDFQVRKAAAASEVMMDTMIDGRPGLELVSEAILDVARNSRLFTGTEVAQGLFAWSAATGQTIGSLNELKGTMTGLETIMRASAITGAGFEATLKGVYGILTQFYAGDLSKTVDVTEKLFYVTQKTSAEFSDLVNSFKMVGPVAASLGVTFEEVLTVIGRLADLGIRGTMAGRAIRQIFIQLVKPSVQALGAINEAFAQAAANGAEVVIDGMRKSFQGQSYYEMVFPEGEYVGVQNHISILAKTLENLTEQERNAVLARISTANSLPVLIAMVNDKYREWATQTSATNKIVLNDAKALFEETWTSMMSGWKGFTLELARAWEALRYTIAAGVATTLAPFVQMITQIIDKVKEWVRANPAVVETLSKMLAGLAAFSAVAGIILSVTGALMGLGAAIYVAVGAFAPLLRVASVVVGAFLGFFDAIVRNATYIQSTLTAAFGDLHRAVGENVDVVGGLIGAVESLLEPMRGIFDIIIRVVTELIALGIRIAAVVVEINKFIPVLDIAAKLLGALVAASVVSKLIGIAIAIKNAALATKGWAVALALVKGQQTAAALTGLAGQMTMFNTQAKVAPGLIGAITGRLAALKLVVGTAGIVGLVIGLGAAAYAVFPPVRDFVNGILSMFRDVNAELNEIKATIGEVGASMDQLLRTQFTTGRNSVRPYGETAETFKQIVDGQVLAAMNTLQPLTDRINKYWAEHPAEVPVVFNIAEVSADVEGFLEHIRLDADRFSQIGGGDPFGLASLLAERLRVEVPPDASRQFWLDWFNTNIQPLVDQGVLRMTAEQFMREFYNETQTTFNALNFEQFRVSNLVGPMLENIMTDAEGKTGLTLQTHIADALSKEFTLDGFGDRVFTLASFPKELLDEPTKAKLDALFGTLYTESMEDVQIPENVSGKASADLAKMLEGSIAVAISDATRTATDDLTRLYPQIEAAIGAGGTPADFTELARLLFEQPLENLGVSAYEAVRTGQVAPDIAKQLIAAMELVATQVPNGEALYRPLIDALGKTADDGSDKLREAFDSFMDSTREAFLGALDGGLQKSFKELRSELNKRLKNPEKYSDASALGKLVKQLADPTILFALSQTDDEKAFQMAYEFTLGNINSAIGGIEDAIDDGDTATANEKLKTLVNNMVSLPPQFWSNLDPEVATGILTWLQTQTDLNIPPGVGETLTSQLQSVIDGSAQNVQAPKVEIPKPEFTGWGTGGGRYNPETGEFEKPKGAVGGGGPAAGIPGMPSTQQMVDATTKNIQAAVTGVVAKVPGMVGPVGTAIMNGITTAITGAAGSVNTAFDTVIRNAINSAESGNTATAWGAGNNLAARFRDGWSSVVPSIMTVVTNMVNDVIAKLNDGVPRARAGGASIANAWKQGLESGMDAALRMAIAKETRLAKSLGTSLPTEGPLQHPESGGRSIGEAWGKGIIEMMGKAQGEVDKKLRALRNQLSTASREVNKWRDRLRNADSNYEKNWATWWLSKAVKQRRDAQAALDRYLKNRPRGHDGDGRDDDGRGGNGDRSGSRDTDRNVKYLRAKINEWKAEIGEAQKEIERLLKGGLTRREHGAKDALNKMIDLLRDKVVEATKKLDKGGGGGRGGDGKGGGRKLTEYLRAKINEWKQEIEEAKKEIQELLKGGLTKVERGRKDALSELIDALRNKIEDAYDKVGKGGGDKAGKAREAIRKQIERTKRQVDEWRVTIINYRNQISDLMRGGLTAEEMRRKDWIEQLIENSQFKINRANKKLEKLRKELEGKGKDVRTRTKKIIDRTPGVDVDTRDRQDKLIIEIQVVSPDGSINSVDKVAFRRAVIDEIIRELKHMVTVR